MTKLDKREQKNLEAAFFRLKERNAELEELFSHEKFYKDQAAIAGSLSVISDLFGTDNWLMKGNFRFDKIRKYKVIHDLEDPNQYVTREIVKIHCMGELIRDWFKQRIRFLAPRFFSNFYEKMNLHIEDHQMNFLHEKLEELTLFVSGDIAECLKHFAKNLGENQNWKIYQSKDQFQTLVFDLSGNKNPVQCVLEMVDEPDD